MADSLDRLIRKEVSLGTIREKEVPNNFVGLAQVAPFLDVDTDDVIFDYIKNQYQEGLAPARAEDAEAELAQKDSLAFGQGRASVIDWALKDKYTASDVSRYREDQFVAKAVRGQVQAGATPLVFTGRTTADFEARMARDDASRRRRLDNRIEQLIMTGLETSVISYNDGKIKWTVDYGRPGDQSNMAPAGGLWNSTTCDPVGDVLAMNQTMYDRYGFTFKKAFLSTKIVNNLWKSNRFLSALGMPVVGGSLNVPLDPNYLGLSGYTPSGALAVLSAATGVTFTIYDAVLRTRPVGSTTSTNTRFTSENKVIFMPGDGDLGEIDDTQIGFAKTLTSPHPEGNWQSGYYEWEQEKVDPWLHVRGSGIKAFPVFPYMQYTSTMTVLP